MTSWVAISEFFLFCAYNVGFYQLRTLVFDNYEMAPMPLRSISSLCRIGRSSTFDILLYFLSKVPGNFHVSTHAAGMNQPLKPDFAHFIDHVSFGDDLSVSVASFNHKQSISLPFRNYIAFFPL